MSPKIIQRYRRMFVLPSSYAVVIFAVANIVCLSDRDEQNHFFRVKTKSKNLGICYPIPKPILQTSHKQFQFQNQIFKHCLDNSKTKPNSPNILLTIPNPNQISNKNDFFFRCCPLKSDPISDPRDPHNAM